MEIENFSNILVLGTWKLTQDCNLNRYLGIIVLGSYSKDKNYSTNLD